MPRAFAYVRVSHQESVESGLSVEGQKEALLRWMEELGLEPAPSHWPEDQPPGCFVDFGVSAWKRKFWERPAAIHIRSEIRPGDYLLFYNLDRGFRSMKDFSLTLPGMLDRDLVVKSFQEQFDFSTATGRLVAHFLVAIAQFRSDVVSERTREALRAKGIVGRSQRLGLRKIHKPQWFPAEGVKKPLEKAPEGPKGRYFGYLRASHLDSVQSGLGLDSQEAAVRRVFEHLERQGHQFGGIYRDLAESAYKTPFFKRPEGAKLDQDLKMHDHVVVARLDRAWRSHEDMLATTKNWSERGISVHFADLGVNSGSLGGDFLLKTLSLAAELEAQFTSAKTSEALQRRAARGLLPTSWGRMGYRVEIYRGEKILVPDTEQLQDIRTILHLMGDLGIGRHKCSDIMERIVAEREGREEIPRTGSPAHGNRKNGVHHLSKGGMIHRTWTPFRCLKAFRKAQNELRDLVALFEPLESIEI